MPTRTYITGPAIIRYGGVSLYSQEGIDLAITTETDAVASDLHGSDIGEILVSRKAAIKLTPVDRIENLAAIFRFGHANIGESIFKAAPLNVASVSAANPAIVTTTTPHGLGAPGSTLSVTIAGTTTTGDINGEQVATVVSATTFSVPINTAGGGQASAAGTATPASRPLQIVCKDGNVYTFERAGVRQLPNLHLGISEGFFSSELEFAALGSLTKAPTAPDYWQKAIAAAFSDTTFDHSTIKRYAYTAEYGAQSGITAQKGFDVMIELSTEEIPDDNYGVGDEILTGITAASKFIPSNLTQPEILALIGLQDTTASLPGSFIGGTGATPLVISGEDADSGFTVTLNGHGFSDANLRYKTGDLRGQEISGRSRLTWTSGAIDPLWALATS